MSSYSVKYTCIIHIEPVIYSYLLLTHLHMTQSLSIRRELSNSISPIIRLAKSLIWELAGDKMDFRMSGSQRKEWASLTNVIK